MNTKKLTDIILLTIIALIIGYDVWAAFNATGGDTFSARILSFSSQHYTIPFAAGIILGHLFWPRHQRLFGLSKYAALIGLQLLVILVGAIDVLNLITWPYMCSIAIFLGYPFGHWLWPQRFPSSGVENS